MTIASDAPEIGLYHPLGNGRNLWRVSSPYGKIRSGKRHRGIDWACPKRTPLYACANGLVYSVDVDGIGIGKFNGNALHIRGDGMLYTYLHTDELVISAGEDVVTGQFIGYSGSTGDSTGPHLHFQCNEDTVEKRLVDPNDVFGPGFLHAPIRISQGLCSGDQGAEVIDLQMALLARRYDPGPVDGDFGPRTLAAVLRYQKDHRLPTDGVVWPMMALALGITLPQSV